MSSHTLRVPGAELHYEVRGTGPFLVVMGSPMGAAAFGPLADALAADHTVVTHDPRGISRSSIDDPDQDSTPELRADDVARLLDALGAETADVFGTSGGAVTGLALVAHHPGRVGTLIAHEPPLLQLLPNAVELQQGVGGVVRTFHQAGVGAAWGAFMALSGFDVGDGIEEANSADSPPPQQEPSEQDLKDSSRFFGHEITGTTNYVPDVPALTKGPTRIVVAVGIESAGGLVDSTTRALAELLHQSVVEVPGDHAGFIGAPVECSEALRAALQSGS